MENLQKFVQDVLDDKVEPFMKSEDVPAEQGDVKVRVMMNSFTKEIHYQN